MQIQEDLRDIAGFVSELQKSEYYNTESHRKVLVSCAHKSYVYTRL